MDGLGHFIRQLREERDISLRELAKRLHVSAPFLSDIELGRRHPSDDVMAKIAQEFGLKVDDLRARDIRPPIDDIRRITQADPTFALAFRTMIAKKVSGADLLDFAQKKGARKPPDKPKK